MELSLDVSFQLVNEGLVGAFLSSVERYYAFDGIAFNPASVSHGISELLANPEHGEAWLVTHQGCGVGHFLVAFGFDLEFGGRQATLTELYLDKDVRHRGIGTAILALIEGRLRQRGIHALELQVAAENTPARSFYRRNGFEAHARIPMSKRFGP
jgi:ribosomal protein S18 acetylase RimI-like enzyme